MGRRQFIEIIDQPWCPRFIREGVTDYLQLISGLGSPYRRALPPFLRALETTGSRTVVDLGSGAGGPWLSLARRFGGETDLDLEVTLTDLYPDVLPEGRRDVKSTSVEFRSHPEPVDARDVPRDLEGFRTLFSSFHHFPPDEARRVLEDAVAKRRGIAIFEMTQRSWLAILMMVLTPCMAFWVTPFIRPFRWTRLLFTYLIPIIPLVTAFDGVVSCLRSYSPDELLEMARGVSGTEYHWEAQRHSAFPPAPIPVTILVGYPRKPAQGTGLAC